MAGDEPAKGERGSGWGEALLARVLLGVAILYVYALLMPTLSRGMLTAGDDAIHAAYTIESANLLKEEGALLGWTDLYGLGEPLYLVRPPGFYWTVLGLRALGFGSLSLMAAQKLAYLLALMLYPAAVYYLLGKFRCPPLVRGMGALLSLAGISTFGHTLDAYYSLGLAKQVFAALALPVALGKLQGILHDRERLWPGALLVAVMLLNHPYLAWMFGLLAGVVAVAGAMLQAPTMVARGREMVRRLGVTVAMLGLGMALGAFWLLPYAASPEIRSCYSMRASRDRDFDKQSETLPVTLRAWADGSLLDRSVSARGVFGGSSPWAWRDNSGRGRWPVLTVFSLVGAVLLLARRRADARLLLVVGGVFSGVIFLGSDDVPLLRLIPLERDFQYAHAIVIVELFAIALAAVGLEALGRLIAERVPARGPLALPAVRLGLLVLLCAPFVGNVLVERWTIGRERAVLRPYEFGMQGQAGWSQRVPGHDRVQEWTMHLQKELGPRERMMADAPDIWKGNDIFLYTLVPASIARGNVASPLIVNIMGGINQWLHFPPVRSALLWNEALSEMLRIRAVVVNAATAVAEPGIANTFPRRFDAAGWSVFSREDAVGPVFFTAARPILVIARQRNWEALCRAWTAQVAAQSPSPALSALPVLVWCNPDWVKRGGPLPVRLEDCQAIVEADEQARAVSLVGEEAVRAFAAAGGVIGETLPALDAEGVSGTDAEVVDVQERRHRRQVRVRVPSDGLLVLKSAFYRGWQVRVDGKPAALLAASPGFSACRVEAGERVVEFVYAGASGGRMGGAVSLAAVLGIVAWELRRVVRSHLKRV